jgi:hypothetical protein
MLMGNLPKGLHNSPLEDSDILSGKFWPDLHVGVWSTRVKIHIIEPQNIKFENF